MLALTRKLNECVTITHVDSGQSIEVSLARVDSYQQARIAFQDANMNFKIVRNELMCSDDPTLEPNNPNNRGKLCEATDCDHRCRPGPETQCGKCKGHFCKRHLTVEDDLCPHCAAAREVDAAAGD